jgi:DNA-binding beta-propeller fold protein YncE
MRSWCTAVAVALALAFGAAPAQAVPFVYVSGGSVDFLHQGELFQFDVRAGGLLEPLSPPTAVIASDFFSVGALAVSPDGQSVYLGGISGDPGVYGGLFGAISQYDVGADGTLSLKTPPTVVVGFFPAALAVSPDGQNVYVSASCCHGFGGAVFQYDVGADGTLLPKTPVMVYSGPLPGGIAVSPDGKSVYVAHSDDLEQGIVSQYDVGAGGTLSPKSPPTVAVGGEYPGEIAVSPDGQSVYVSGLSGFRTGNLGEVFQYDVGAGGTLSPKSQPKVVVAPFLGGFGLSPEGQSFYVSGASGGRPSDLGEVFQYDVGAGGALSSKSPPSVTAGSVPAGLAVSPDGQSVYVANSFSNNVSQYDVGAGGALSPKSPATVSVGDYAGAVAVSPPRVPTRKEQCKRGGWHNFAQFRNEGECVSFVQRHL